MNFILLVLFWKNWASPFKHFQCTLKQADFPEDKSKYVNPYKELVLSLFRQSDHTITSIVYAIFDKMKDKNSPEVQKYVDMIDEVKKELGDLLSDDAVFFYPFFPSYAPKHGEFLTFPELLKFYFFLNWASSLKLFKCIPKQARPSWKLTMLATLQSSMCLVSR